MVKKVSDFIVEYLISRGIEDVFGYPGGMVTHLMDSFRKYERNITAHITYHEQGAAFAACGYAQTSGIPGVAYATSGPGATNLITGICNAFFDSIPCLFITGQVNTFESKNSTDGMRQKGFQETEIIPMVKNITKYAAYVEAPEHIKYHLDRAFYEIMNGRKGPVLLDIPMNIFRSEIIEDDLEGYYGYAEAEVEDIPFINELSKSLARAQRPCLLLGNGVKIAQVQSVAKRAITNMKLPVVTSMIAFDIIGDSPYTYGFIGAYGNRTANFIVAKSDLIIAIGSRLDIRQVGLKRENFAPNAQIIRVDIDLNEMRNKVHENETQFIMSVEKTLQILEQITLSKSYDQWLKICHEIRNKLQKYDERNPNLFVKKFSHYIPEGAVITTDVGQNQVWVAQSFVLKHDQKVLFSGGHGAMGYSLPAAIGAYYGCGRKPVICFSGDGGFQMNIQELQFIASQKIPIKIIVINNKSLGMIRHFQEMYFEKKYYQTTTESGYTTPNFTKIASAYGIRQMKVTSIDEIKDYSFITDNYPILVELVINEKTYVFPKLEFGQPNHDQEPLLDRDVFNQLMKLDVP